MQKAKEYQVKEYETKEVLESQETTACDNQANLWHGSFISIWQPIDTKEYQSRDLRTNHNPTTGWIYDGKEEEFVIKIKD